MSVMVGACVSVGMVNLLKKNGRCVAATWPAVQSLVKALHDPGWQVSGQPVERLGRQGAISGGRLYVYYMCIGS